ncbi:ankyrin repeat domain-containing protein [Nitratifractor sp.]
MATDTIARIIEAALRDERARLRAILSKESPDLNVDVRVGEEYDLDEYDEIPLLFYLIMHGAEREVIEILCDAGMDLMQTNREGLGAVDMAIKYRRPEIVRLCKERGLDLNESRRKSGMTPLMLAAAFNDLELVRYLIAEGVEIGRRDRYGMNALDYARKLGQSRVREFLETLEEEDPDRQ